MFSERVELNIKYRSLFVDQSRNAPERNKMNKTRSDNQSKRSGTFENNREVNENGNQAKFAPTKRREKFKTEKYGKLNINLISNSNQVHSPKLALFKKEMERD